MALPDRFDLERFVTAQVPVFPAASSPPQPSSSSTIASRGACELRHSSEKHRFAHDSALEEDGFEPSVPPVKETAMERGIRGQPSSSRETRA